MKNILRLEEVAMFALCIYALTLFHVSWWVYLLLLIAPDISMVGYAAGNKVGAFSYDLFHHKGIAIAIFLTGFILKNEWMQIIGIVLLGHSSMDRTLGYGLKLKDGFKSTHLGFIGKK
ncbi:MAG TPA: DUF4260 domain-containing protein [Chitinophagaceae bacterium]|nr:DUF4260 domain-containing protein [Chitinophagaceae bacterium]